ncbi:hypothetical protein ACOAKC_07325 [Hathewaya histolytica]|uniref:hypothetical protein n=1 Tax=Hathewaya histolytica TaxID=1498 RepID=UPI003B6798C2
MQKNFPKGEYEKAVEKAKHLLGKDIGFIEVTNETGLSGEDIIKIQNKIIQKKND